MVEKLAFEYQLRYHATVDPSSEPCRCVTFAGLRPASSCSLMLARESCNGRPASVTITINLLHLAEFPFLSPTLTSNQVVGGSNPSGRANQSRSIPVTSL